MKSVIYEFVCSDCNVVFEKSSEEVGYEPFVTECPECGAEISSNFATIYEMKGGKNE